MVRIEDIGRTESLLGRALTDEEKMSVPTPEQLLSTIRLRVEEESEGNAMIENDGQLIPAQGSNVLYREEMLSDELRELLRQYREVQSHLK